VPLFVPLFVPLVNNGCSCVLGPQCCWHSGSNYLTASTGDLRNSILPVLVLPLSQKRSFIRLTCNGWGRGNVRGTARFGATVNHERFCRYADVHLV